MKKEHFDNYAIHANTASKPYYKWDRQNGHYLSNAIITVVGFPCDPERLTNLDANVARLADALRLKQRANTREEIALMICDTIRRHESFLSYYQNGVIAMPKDDQPIVVTKSMIFILKFGLKYLLHY